MADTALCEPRPHILVKGTIEDLEAVRESEKAMDEWFEQAAILAQSVGTVPQVRRTSRHQQHRDNVGCTRTDGPLSKLSPRTQWTGPGCPTGHPRPSL